MLILIAASSQIEAILTNPLANIFPGIGFFIAGLIGGIITNDNYKKAILMVAISYIVIGLVTALSLSINCQNIECFYVFLTLFGIPIGTVLSSIGMVLGYYIKEKNISRTSE